MDIIEEIKKYLKKNDQLPWPVGYDEKKASNKAKFFAALLSREELIAISKFCPLKKLRNQILIDVRDRYQIPVVILPVLTGLCDSSCRTLVGRDRRKK